VLPAVGYGKAQMVELMRTINAVPCDVVVLGTPVNLARHMKLNKPVVRVTYEIDGDAAIAIEKIIKASGFL
jgi:predicted GTPase